MDIINNANFTNVSMIENIERAPLQYGLDMIGFFGPIILLILNMWQLWGNAIYSSVSLVVFFINMCINKILKVWIREPRPSGGQSMITSEDYGGIEQYGMPSAHSQSAFCSVTFLYLVKHSVICLIGGLSIISLTLYQRWKYRRHSIEQLAVGAMVGILVAYISYTVTTKIITGQ